jgi:hypothetical protein
MVGNQLQNGGEAWWPACVELGVINAPLESSMVANDNWFLIFFIPLLFFHFVSSLLFPLAY